MTETEKLILKLRKIANDIETNKLNYSFAHDRLLIDKMYQEVNLQFNKIINPPHIDVTKHQAINFTK